MSLPAIGRAGLARIGAEAFACRLGGLRYTAFRPRSALFGFEYNFSVLRLMIDHPAPTAVARGVMRDENRCTPMSVALVRGVGPEFAGDFPGGEFWAHTTDQRDRKSTRLNS